MEFSSSRLENEGEVESLCTQIPNDDDSTDEDGLEFGKAFNFCIIYLNSVLLI
jgi:hypothetical protein